jgi:hypothetical protein
MSDDFAMGWQPEVDVPLSGTVTAISEREGKYGNYRIVTAEKDDGEAIAIHAFHSVLAQELTNVGVGDSITVTYLGKKTSKAGKPFHAYRVDTSS